ncbi:MAG: hypothetical protein ABFD90_03930 [Phycisphaerales bacterium]
MLPIVTVVGVIVAVLGTGMLTVAYGARMSAVRTAQTMAARVAADNGLTMATRALSSQYADGTLNSQSLPSETDIAVPNFEGTFTYAVSERLSGGYTITAVGNFQDARRTVEAVMTCGGLVHEYALFALDALVLNNSASIDWYNNDDGDAPLKIGTNSTDDAAIVLHNSSCINGDVVIGAGGDPANVICKNGGRYTGSVSAQSENHEPPAVSVPSSLASHAGTSVIDSSRTISSSGKYSSIDLGNSEKLIISGNVELYIAGKVTLCNSAQIQVNEGSSLVLYVAGDVEGKNSSQFNNKTKDPRCLKLFGTNTCANITVKNSGDMYAVVYAPSAALTLDNSAALRGSATTRTCTLKNSASVRYDASLREYEDPAFVGTLKLSSWREY